MDYEVTGQGDGHEEGSPPSVSVDEKGLGERLQGARKAAGMTQQALCQKANISYSTLAKIERGAIKSPSIFTIQNLVVALGGSLDELLGIKPAGASHEGGAPQTDQPVQAPAKQVSKNGIKFVYFDINGCLVHFFQRAFTSLAKDTGASVDDIERVFWNHNAEVCRGELSLEAFNAELANITGAQTVDWEAYYLDSVEAIKGMDEVVHWAAEHYRIGLCSNIMPGFIPALRARGLLPDVHFDVIIDSSEVHAIKPENKIFEIAAEKAGVEPHEILLIDDDTPNVIAADKLGWHVLSCDEYQPEDTALRIKQALELAE
jgi:FMN phosphatase YigB (HAD superfamily)/transcriptional regulator with XRE-family HTH domain